MTNFCRTLITLSALTLVALVVPVNALAQKDAFSGSARRDHSANCACVTRYHSQHALNQAARRIAYQSQRFQWRLERELNSSHHDGTSREKLGNQLSLHFRHAADNLRSLYAVGRSVDNSKIEAGNLLHLGSKLDGFLREACVSPATLEAWDEINCELISLAMVYDLDAADLRDAEARSVTPALEHQSAALSYSRIWRWPF